MAMVKATLPRAAAGVEDGEQALAAGDEGGERLGDAGPDRHGREVNMSGRLSPEVGKGRKSLG